MDYQNEDLQVQTEELWTTLSRTFPQADIRFQREEGSSTLHIIFREYDDESHADHSVVVDLQEIQIATTEAIFSIKEVLKLYDA